MFGECGWLVERLAGLVTAYAIVFLLTEGRFGRKATVAAFAEKHGARLFYDAPDGEGVFRLQMLLPPPESRG